MTTHPNEPSEPDQQPLTSPPSRPSPSGHIGQAITFDPGSVRRAGVILMTLTAALFRPCRTLRAGPLGALIGIPLAAAGVSILGTYRRSYDLVPEAAAHVGDTRLPG